jgi:hypothetical protein
MWLALALHDRYGWPIRVQIGADEVGEYIAHAYVVHPSGLEIDILGPQDVVDIFSGEVRDLSRADVLALTGAPGPEVRRRVREAEAVLDRYVEPKLEGLR